jgi:RNAse (barnase) inhibitor barstar
MEFTVIKHAEVRKESRKSGHPNYTFTPEFIKDFDQLWDALKDGHYLDKLSLKFSTVSERNKFLRYAKAYGDTRGIFVSNTDVEETKDTPRLNIRMELADAREKRIQERNARRALIEEYKALGGDPSNIKRGRLAAGEKEFDVEAAVKKLRAEKANKEKEKGQATAPQTHKHPSVPPVPGPQGNAKK